VLCYNSPALPLLPTKIGIVVKVALLVDRLLANGESGQKRLRKQGNNPTLRGKLHEPYFRSYSNQESPYEGNAGDSVSVGTDVQ